ncbi:MAG: VOC family protein [Candidatus Thiodiazotropha sp.]|jgi:methylmalonyl-CoA/ethylmalonyl-CoA epimerase
MNVDHVCIAVRSIPATRKRLCEILGYSEKTQVVKNTRQDVLVQFFQKEGSLDIKLIQPASPDSPLKNFLKSRGEGLHHLCFKADDVHQTMNALSERGARITADPLPGEAFDDELIAFAYVAGGLNIEVIDTDKRRDLI